MVRSSKFFLLIFSFIVTLSSNVMLPMASRLTRTRSAFNQALIARSLVRTLQPQQRWRIPGVESSPSSLAIQARSTAFAPVQVARKIEQEPIKARAESKKPAVAQKNIEPKQSVSAVKKSEAVQKKQPSGNSKVKKAASATPKRATESVREMVRRILKANAPQISQAHAMQDTSAKSALVKEPSMAVISQPLEQMPIPAPYQSVISEPTKNKAEQIVPASIEQEPIIIAPQPESELPAAALAPIDSGKAVQLINPVLDALSLLANAKPNASDYVRIHDRVREALLNMQREGYSLGLVEKNSAKQAGGQPLTVANQAQSRATIIPAQTLGISSPENVMVIPAQALGALGAAHLAQAANVFGLPGEYVPFIYKNGTLAGVNPADNIAAIQIVSAPIKQNSPLISSRIIMQPLGQLMPPAAQTGMSTIEQGPAGNNDGNKSNNNNQPPLNNERVKFDRFPDAGSNGRHRQNNGNIPSGTNGMLSLGTVSDIEENQPEPSTIPEVPEIELPEGSTAEIAAEQEAALPIAEEPIIPAKKVLTHADLLPEEIALELYGNLILQALDARTYLRQEWAGESQALLAMFNDYNALLSWYTKRNFDLLSEELYSDSNRRIHRVVSTVLDRLKSLVD